MFASVKSKFILAYILIVLLSIAVYFFSNSPSKTWKLPSSSEVIAFSPNGEMLAIASGKKISKQINPKNTMKDNMLGSSKVEIRNVTTGRIIQTLDFFSAGSLAFSPDNNFIAAGGYAGEVTIWRISDGQLVHNFREYFHYIDKITFLSFTPDGKYIVASAVEPVLINQGSKPFSVWNLATDQNHYTLSKPATCAAASPDGQLIAIGGYREALTLYQLQDGTPLRKIHKASGTCKNLKFSSDSKLVIFESTTGLETGTHLHRVQDGKLLRLISNCEPNGDNEYLFDIELSPDNQYLASSYIVASDSGFLRILPSYQKAFFGRIRLWNIENGKRVATLWGHRGGTNTIAFSPDGKWLASAGRNNRIHFWRMSPRNYYLWLFVTVGLAAVAYWRRAWLMNLFNRST